MANIKLRQKTDEELEEIRQTAVARRGGNTNTANSGAERRAAQTAEGKLTAALEAAAGQAGKLEANKNAAPEDGVQRFSIKRTSQMTLAAQLKMFYDGKMASSDAFYFGETPDTLAATGLDPLPLAFTVSDFRKSATEKHNVPRRVWKNLHDSLENALFAFRQGDRVGIMTGDIDGDGKPLLVGIERNAVMDRKPVNAIRSVYGLDNPGPWLQNQLKSGKEYIPLNKQRADAFLQTYGAYSASVGDGIRSTGDIVTQDGGEVKSRFSLKSPVEQTQTLVALHNMHEEKLRRTLELGAWPSPSIAIVQAAQGHADYGAYSAVFPRSTIDPEADPRNKVYGSDAWTPTHSNAQIEYEVNFDVLHRFDRMVADLTRDFAGGALYHTSPLGGIVSEETSDDIDKIAEKLTGKEKAQARSAEEALTAALEASSRTVEKEIRKNKNAAQKSDGARYSLGKTTRNQPFVEVEEDILAGVAEADWVTTVKDNLKEKFPNGITVGKNNIRINQQSLREMTFSKYMKWLYNNDPQLRADKFRATNNADEILKATTDWVNEGLSHPRKDSIADFARGNVLLRVGGNDYAADVVVGTRQNGSMILYDILNLQPASFTKKETDAAKAKNPSPGTDRSAATVSKNSISTSGEKSKTKYSMAGTKELMQEMNRIMAERGDKSDEEVQKEIHEAVERVYQQMVSDYGAIPAGEQPARQVQVPRKTGENKKVSRTVRTILEAKATPEEALPDIQKLVAMGEFSYEVYSDKQAIEDATAQIESSGGKGWSQAQRDWFDAMKQGKVSKENTTLGWVLYNNAVNSGDTKTALDVLNEMVRHQRNAAQALQATRILKKLSPETQLYNAQRSVNNLQEELTKKYGKNAPHLHIDETLAEAYLQAKTEDARDEAMGKLYMDIGRQMPSRFMDKWTAWRYVAMLGNLRTHVRNIVGNAGFAPVVMTKNKVAAGLETAVDKLSGGKAFTDDRGSRTKSLTRGERDLRQAANGDYDNVIGQIMSGGKYQDYDKNSAIEQGRVIFRFKPLEKFRTANAKALELEDGFFARRHYRAALASYCKANGITAETVRSGKGIEMARAYAIREAQKATYRDANAFSEAVSGLGRYKGDNEAKKALSIMIEGVLPFRKTPANILARGVEYSPIGLVKGLTWDLYRVAKGEKHTSEMLDELSAGLTGTGLLMLGFWLAGEGLIRGIGAGDDEKEREFAKLQGHQDYALELPNGTSVTLDWLAPEALPFFVGVNLQEQMANKEEGEEMNMADWMTVLSNISEPILEMSCLQSLNDLLSSVGYGIENGSALLSTVASAATSYLTQGLPTLLGQFERSSEAVRMTTYTEGSKWLTKDMQYALGRASARIPGWDYDQIPYIDAWGREDLSGSVVSRVLNNFLNPAYISKVDSSEMEQELQRLYDQTGDGAVFPTRAGWEITINGEDKTLTGEEYVKYATIRGQTAYGVIGNLVESSQYQDMSDEERAECVSLAYTYATAYGKTKVSDYQPDGWVSKAIYSTKQYSIPEDVYICAYQRKREFQSLEDEDGNTIPNSLSLQIMEMVYSIPGLSETQRRAMFSDFGVGKSVTHYSEALVVEKLEKMRK